MVVITAFLAGCVIYRSGTMYTASEPLVAPVHGDSVLKVERCQPLLFDFIELAPRYTLREMVDEATDNGRRPIVEVVVDRDRVWWLIGTTMCDTLTARPTQRQGPTGVASMEQTAKTQSGPDPGMVAMRIYREMGMEIPAEDVFTADVKAVGQYLAAGKTPEQLIEAARRGMAATGLNAYLDALLAAGFEPDK